MTDVRLTCVIADDHPAVVASLVAFLPRSGIQVVDQETRGPIGYRAAAHRSAARAMFWFVAFLAITDPSSQTLHDRSAGTLVVKVDPPDSPSGRSSERIEFETTDDA